METGIYEPSAAAETQPELEAQQNLFARIGDTVRNGYDHARDNIKTYAAIGTASLTLAGAELTTATEPVAAESNALAQVSNLKGLCVRAALERPQVEYAEMIHPGKLSQRTDLKINYDSMPAQCSKKFQRVDQYRILLQDAKNPGKWIDIYSWNNSYFTRNTEGYIQASTRVGVQDKDFHLRCTPGPKKTGVKLELRNTLRSKKNHHRIARKSYYKPVKVIDGC